MELLSALAPESGRAEAARSLAASSARDRAAIDVIGRAALAGDDLALAFMGEAADRIRLARVHRARAQRLHRRAARAASMGEDKIASLASASAESEGHAADAVERCVVGAVARAHDGEMGYLSDDEAAILRRRQWLSRSTAAEAEQALASMLARLERDQLGADDEDDAEIDDDRDPASRLFAAVDVLGGDAGLVFGQDALARIGSIFQASVATLRKRLARKKKKLREIEQKLEQKEEQGKDGLAVKILRGRVERLEASIARIEEKIAQRTGQYKKVKSAEAEQADTAEAEDDVLAPAGEASLSEKERQDLARHKALSSMTASQREAAVAEMHDRAMEEAMGGTGRLARKKAIEREGKKAAHDFRQSQRAAARQLFRGEGYLYAGSPVTDDRKVTIAFFDRRAEALGGGDLDQLGADDVLGATIFDSIANFFRKLFGKAEVESARVQRGLAARRAARQAFAPQVSQLRTALSTERAARAREVADVRLRHAPALRSHREQLAHVLAARRAAGAAAYKAGRKGQQQSAESIPASAFSRVVEGKGGWSYEQRADGSIKIVDAPRGHRPGRVLSSGPKYKAILREIGSFPGGGAASAGPSAAADVVEGKGGWHYQVMPGKSVRIVKAPVGHEKAEGKVLSKGPAHKAIARELDLDSRATVGAEAGPLETIARANPRDRAAILARHLDLLVAQGLPTSDRRVKAVKQKLQAATRASSLLDLDEDDQDLAEAS